MPNSRDVRACSVLVPVLCVALSACTTGAAAPPVDPRPRVLATFTVLADMAGVVGGQDVVVESVTGPGTEIHGYEPTPDDLRRAAGADLLIANGLGLEAWLEDLLRPLDLPTVVLTEGLEPAGADSGASSAAPGDHGPQDPHAWMSPRRGAQYARDIARALAGLDPPRAQDYAARAEAYAVELEELHATLLDRLGEVPPGQRFLVTCEGAFSHLAEDAGLDQGYLWPVNAERQGTPRQVADLILAVREREVPAVFCESTVSAVPQRQVARETGALFGGVLYVDSLSGPDGPVPTYLDLLRHDVDVIVAGLTGGRG